MFCMDYTVAVTGYPSSGKGLVSEIAEDIGFKTIVMGDYVRSETEKQWSDRLEESKKEKSEDTPSDVYREFATEKREIHGRGVVAEWCREDIISAERPVFIDGIRSPEEREAFEEFTDIKLIYTHAPMSLRLEWIQERARDGEEEFNAAKLLERDSSENHWGLNELIQTAEYTVHNCTTKTAFESDVHDLLSSLYEGED